MAASTRKNQDYQNDEKRIAEVETINSDEGKAWDNSRELIFETSDGWFYRFRELVPGEGFEFKHKRRPDNELSNDDTVPLSIINYFDSHATYSLINAKTHRPETRL